MFAKFLMFMAMLDVCQVVEPALVRAPENTAVTQGSDVTLNCSSDASSQTYITWFNVLCETYDYDTNDCTRIYNGFNGRRLPARYTVTSENNANYVTRDLSIRNIHLTDAGVYVCVENVPPHGVQQAHGAQLVVITDVDGTVCSTNLPASGAVQEYDVITMTCSIRYTGNWAPVMRWNSSLTRHNFTDDVITMTTNDTTVTSELTVTTTADLHGSQIVCVTYFTESSTSLKTTAANIPTYTSTFEFQMLNVALRFPPEDIRITPRQSTYQPGDRIQCASEGNPEPSYQWTDLVSGTVIQGDVLVISEDMVNNSHTFQCTARNYYNGQHYMISDNITFTSIVQGGIGGEPIDPLSGITVYVIAGVAAGAFFFILIIIVILLSVIACRKQSIQTSQHSTTATTDISSTQDVTMSNNNNTNLPDVSTSNDDETDLPNIPNSTKLPLTKFHTLMILCTIMKACKKTTCRAWLKVKPRLLTAYVHV